jgi:hypothetical protein
VTIAFKDPYSALYWPFFRLVDAGWCRVAEMHTLTLDDVSLANATLDDLEVARAEKDP